MSIRVGHKLTVMDR